MQTFLVFLVTITCAVVAVLAAPQQGKCDATTKCPKSTPCCNQAGLCGVTNDYCLSENCNSEASFSPISCHVGSAVNSGVLSGGMMSSASITSSDGAVDKGTSGDKPRCKSYRENFQTTPRVALYDDWDKTDEQADWVNMANDPEQFLVTKGMLELYLKKPAKPYGKVGGNLGTGVTLMSTRTMQYGIVEANIKMATPGGVVTAFITYSDVQHDEIDFEWVGKNHRQVQSNYYVNNIRDYTKGQFHDTQADLTNQFHRYLIDWSPDRIIWKLDGRTLRTLYKKDTCKNGTCLFPDEAARIQIGIWDASFNKNLAGWSGGPVQWDQLPDVVIAEVDWIDIKCDPNYNLPA